jgi:hypothetical protein
VPTALLVGVGVVLSGGAFAARFGPGTAFTGGAQPQAPAVVSLAGLTMPPPGGQSRANKIAAMKAANPAAAAAVPNPNCTLTVPANPLTAAGLATPYQLTATNPAAGPCNEANKAQSAFVQGAIISPAGQLTLYDPLVIDQGTAAAVAPTPAQVPAGSTVGLWFGFNGTNLTLAAAAGTNSLTQGNCVNGLPASIFGQFSSCNGQTFFAAANAAIGQNLLQIPPLGTALDGMPCPTVRDFSLVDQDQSDNVTTHYLANANGQTAQNNAAGKAAIPAAVDLANGSDNLLLNAFVLPTLGCTLFARPNGANDGATTPSLALDELQAAAAQAAPVALVPLNDPMVQVNAMANTTKMNLYRAQVNQPPAGTPATAALTAADVAGNPTTYCANLFNSATGIVRVFNDMALLANGASPNAAAATNLFTFLAMRGNQSFTNLNCTNLLNQPNPITLTMNNNIVTAATFTPAKGTAAAAAFKPPAAAAPAANPAAAPAANPAAAVPTTTVPAPAAANPAGAPATTTAPAGPAAQATTAPAPASPATGLAPPGPAATWNPPKRHGNG